MRARDHLAKVPPELGVASGAVAEIDRLERLLGGTEGEIGAGRVTVGDDGSVDTGVGSIPELAALVDRVRLTEDPGELVAAIATIRAGRRGMPAGHPQHATTLTWLADLESRHALLADARGEFAQALDAAIAAVRIAPRTSIKAAATLLVMLLGKMQTQNQRVGPFEQAEAALKAARTIADPEDATLQAVLTIGEGAACSIRTPAAGDEDLSRRARHAFAGAERMLPAEQLTEEWFAPAWMLFAWSYGHAVRWNDGRAAAVADRTADRLEDMLNGDPQLAERVAQGVGPSRLNVPKSGRGVLQVLRTMRRLLPLVQGEGSLGGLFGVNGAAVLNATSATPWSGPGEPDRSVEEARWKARRGLERAARTLGRNRPGVLGRAPLSPVDPPDPQTLRAASADLHAALAGNLDDTDVRQQVESLLGLCLAELYWLGQSDQVTAPAPPVRALLDAVNHLEGSFAASEHTLPTTERVELMDVLARCYRELARRQLRENAGADAESTVLAALHELARRVLTAAGMTEALDVAGLSTDIMTRAIGWCLADDRPGVAVEMAEAGRSLVLASVILAGQVEEHLRGAGEDEAAAGWRRGDTPGRLAGLSALWGTRLGEKLLTTPTIDEISGMLLVAAADIDAVVYLVPPLYADDPLPGDAARAAPPARALIVRPGFGRHIETLDLPGVALGPETAVGRYMAAFGAALDAADPTRRNPDGFRGGPAGHAWADALDGLGRWAYACLIGPLVERSRSWSLDRRPRVALVPLGELAAVPCAAAWTEDSRLPGGRRYAVHDLVLSYTASARVLADVARRPRRRLNERVVMVTDPTGEFPFTRKAGAALTAGLYPGAEVYGRKSAPGGAASTERVLSALPGDWGAGASLLHLSTHATLEPVAAIQTADGWLELSRILAHARTRPPDSAGGLVITSACLTDSTRTRQDEALTLATALLAAGATGVIGTRWPIDDDMAAVFMHRLHHHLAGGHAPAEALRQAQLDLLDPEPRWLRGLHPHLARLPSERFAHPASWAGYVHHGA
jgi:hypothetical protein